MEQYDIRIYEIARSCIEYLDDPHNIQLYETIIESCKKLAHRSIRKDYHTPSTVGKMIYQPYAGQGHIHVEKTIQGLSMKGRNMGSVVARGRENEIRKNSFALLIDNSFVATRQGLESRIYDDVSEEQAPEVLRKIAAISILESIRKTSDSIDIIPFSDQPDGPYSTHQYPYRQILLQRSNGFSRLDLALARLMQIEWDKKFGVKHLVILTTGLPEIGRRRLLDDIEVQETTIQYLKHLQKLNVKILYLCLTDERFANMRVGSHSPESFIEKISRFGIASKQINGLEELPMGLYSGFKDMHSSRTGMPIFDLEHSY